MLQKYPIFAFLRIMPDLLVDGHIYRISAIHSHFSFKYVQYSIQTIIAKL